MTGDDNFYSGHRARLRQKFLDDKLADYELMELLLGYAIPRRDVRPLARALMKKFGGVYGVFTASRDELLKMPGMGENSATFIKVIHQIMLLGYKQKLDEKPIFFNQQLLIDFCKLSLSGKNIEEFHIMYLDKDMRLLATDVHSRGTNTWSAVYPREIVKRVLELNAMSVVLLHNHPVSGLSFSRPDVDMTKQIIKMLQAIDVRLYDHFLVSGGKVHSMRSMLLLE